MSVTSVAVPPVDRLAVDRTYTIWSCAGIDSARKLACSSIFCACASSSRRVKHFFVADAAARVLIHDLDQLGDGVLPIADDVAGRAARRGDQFAIDHQQAVVVAFQEGLDDDRSRMLARDIEALRDFFIGRQADRDAAAVIAVVRLGHDGEPDALRGAHGLRGAVDQLLLGHGQAESRRESCWSLLCRWPIPRRCARCGW